MPPQPDPERVAALLPPFSSPRRDTEDQREEPGARGPGSGRSLSGHCAGLLGLSSLLLVLHLQAGGTSGLDHGAPGSHTGPTGAGLSQSWAGGHEAQVSFQGTQRATQQLWEEEQTQLFSGHRP